MLLFFAMFVLLAEPHTPAALAVVGRAARARSRFEVLKQLSRLLIAPTQGNPAFQAFGIALILLVWINYFSRVVLYAAAWAHTSRRPRAPRAPEPEPRPVAGSAVAAAARGTGRPPARPGWVDAVRRRGRHGARRGRRTQETTHEGRHVKLERKHGWLLLGVAVWNVVIWLTFAKNLAAAHASGEDRPTGYWVAHTVLIVVDLVIAVVLGLPGLKVLPPTRPDADPSRVGAEMTPTRRQLTTGRCV